MIDTDKYEGHTEGPWKPYRFDNMIWTVGNLTVEWQEADKLLIADAPLLLQEVKRLRSDMAYCASLITCMVDMGDPLSLFVVREGMLDSIGMTVDEAMATTDLMGVEEE